MTESKTAETVDELIDRISAKYPSIKNDNPKFYVDVHQELAPKARELEALLAAANERADKATENAQFRYDGMMNWKREAEAKDKTIIELQQSLASARQVAMAECISICKEYIAGQESLRCMHLDEEGNTKESGIGYSNKALGAEQVLADIERAAQLPPTHMFVPKEPTEEMLIAAANSIAKYIIVYADDLSTAYKAMLAAHEGGVE